MKRLCSTNKKRGTIPKQYRQMDAVYEAEQRRGEPQDSGFYLINEGGEKLFSFVKTPPTERLGRNGLNAVTSSKQSDFSTFQTLTSNIHGNTLYLLYYGLCVPWYVNTDRNSRASSELLLVLFSSFPPHPAGCISELASCSLPAPSSLLIRGRLTTRPCASCLTPAS